MRPRFDWWCIPALAPVPRGQDRTARGRCAQPPV